MQQLLLKTTLALAAAATVAFVTYSFSATPLAKHSAQNPDSSKMLSSVNVSGYWTIEVRNPDGTLAQKTEFHNAYVDSNNIVPQLLLGLRSFGFWQIHLESSSNVCGASGDTKACTITSPKSEQEDTNRLFVNLQTGHEEHTITLQGNLTVQVDGYMHRVRTYLGTCDPDILINNCAYPSYMDAITMHTMADHIDVIAGQQVMVKVELGFH